MWKVNEPADAWSVPLLASFLDLRQDNWEALFDVKDEMITFDDDEITFMVKAVCMVLGIQKLYFHAVQLWGGDDWNIRSCQVSVPKKQ